MFKFEIAQAQQSAPHFPPAHTRRIALVLPLFLVWLADYKLLQVTRSSSKEAVKQAYELLATPSAEATYSTDTLFSRAVLLKSAADCLADKEQRRWVCTTDHNLWPPT